MSSKVYYFQVSNSNLMTLGAFLLLIFVLWLIDKHSLWRKALKVFIVLIVFCAAFAVALWLYQQHVEKHEEAEQKVTQAALLAEQRSDLANCIKRLITSPQDSSALQVDAKSTCEDNPKATSSDSPKWYMMRASDGKWYKTLAFSTEEARSKIEKAPLRQNRSLSVQIHHLLAIDDVDLYTSEFGSLVCAHVAKSETVTLLEDDSIWVKVKVQSGKSGWAQSSGFKMTD